MEKRVMEQKPHQNPNSRIIMILLEENDADWEKAMDARIDEIENDRGHE